MAGLDVLARGRILPSDITALGMNAFFAILSLVCAGKATPGASGFSMNGQILAGCLFLAAIPLQWFLIRLLSGRKHPLAGFFRLFYPQALFLPWFSQSIILSQLIYGGASLDARLAGLEEAMFGFQPSLAFHRAVSNSLVTELFFAAYFSYYFLVIGPWWLLYARGKVEEASRCLFITTAAFSALIIWYVFFPVQGPKYYFPKLRGAGYAQFRGYALTAFMTKTFRAMNLGGAAFPSSHVAISTIALALNARHNRRLLPLLLPLTLLLWVSTVYIYAHYVLDAVAGVVVGAVIYLPMALLYRPAERMAGRLGSRLRYARLL
jgi:membrane-associated phospholipid phosphatase